MNNRYTLALTLMSLVAMPSCTDASKTPAQAEGREEIPAKSVSHTAAQGAVKHLEDLMTSIRAPQDGRGDNALDALNNALKNNPKVVLDFYAEWCGPCKKLGPVLDAVAAEYTDVLFVKINVDTFGSVSEKFSVQGIPALMFYKDGKRVERTTGFMSKSDLKKTLKKLD